ncbi:hypothetical protein LZ31DRAFT_559636 [Colletotrichum somersetense]|nr:hypothetical protein LZ31DRAFT_559636 [Colletotrichum somersetense]
MSWIDWVHQSEAWNPNSKVCHHHVSFVFAESRILLEVAAKITTLVGEATLVVDITDDNEANVSKCHIL